MYKLKYMSLALKDMRDITDYIADTLKAPKAAMDLVDAMDSSIAMLQEFPYSCKIYQPMKDLENEYRLLSVKNYLVFYVVKEQVVEIHRVIYAKMDLTKVIN
ncbi:type II toxin-antitoxin system RelE/ParE family toxin [Paenibacillus alginolyticus]|uniref:type II toxin-antitoxin system RelE/ParE family toxin n=1 Tax=Paenibacillus alginolyticus TaxID=59839 RepID=UPI000425D603|nr:type II toxin-antitoxin system RelE/ParE family toxin [Paenibacillus alginolyticus]MCY9666266.1 type II toxin-antitoxin system RelE/ParE family toxin [Paenibacillus alginolyticus]